MSRKYGYLKRRVKENVKKKWTPKEKSYGKCQEKVDT